MAYNDELPVITEEQKRRAELILSQIQFHNHTPIRFEWFYGGSAYEGYATVEVIMKEEDRDSVHWDSTMLNVPVEWQLPE